MSVYILSIYILRFVTLFSGHVRELGVKGTIRRDTCLYTTIKKSSFARVDKIGTFTVFLKDEI